MRILLIDVLSALLLYVVSSSAQETSEKSAQSELSIVIKDDGVEELVRGDVAMILYITVTNTGRDSLHLSINVTKCCQKFGSTEEVDCESMKPFGGDAGELSPQDPRNLTAIYPTLYLHDREGSCEIDIISEDGRKMSRTVKFDTRLPTDSNVRVPRLLEQYYDSSELTKCASVDQDPLNRCRPVSCIAKYTGHRNFFNHSSHTCEKLPGCISNVKHGTDKAYVPELNSCFELKEKLSEEELAEFKEGMPGIHTLVHAHKYPMNIKCHYGKFDPESRRCDCDKGWASAPFDPASFNFDVQEYHMCTIWTGEMSAKEAANITTIPKERQQYTTAIIFSVLGGIFVIVAIFLIVTYFKQKQPKLSEIVAEENIRLMDLNADDNEDDTLNDDEEIG